MIYISIFAKKTIIYMMGKVLKLDNIDQYNSLYGLEILHPLVSVVDLTKATQKIDNVEMHYGVYALF